LQAQQPPQFGGGMQTQRMQPQAQQAGQTVSPIQFQPQGQMAQLGQQMQQWQPPKFQGFGQAQMQQQSPPQPQQQPQQPYMGARQAGMNFMPQGGFANPYQNMAANPGAYQQQQPPPPPPQGNAFGAMAGGLGSLFSDDRTKDEY
jgi:hypothetical protein